MPVRMTAHRIWHWAGSSTAFAFFYPTLVALSLPIYCYAPSCPVWPGTFAEWGLAGPLGRVTGDTGDGDLADELKALVAEEA